MKFPIRDTSPAVRRNFTGADATTEDSKNNCFVEGDLLAVPLAPTMHVNFAGVYLNATGIIHAHGQSRNLEHVSLDNSNEQVFIIQILERLPELLASDLAWETARRRTQMRQKAKIKKLVTIQKQFMT